MNGRRIITKLANCWRCFYASWFIQPAMNCAMLISPGTTTQSARAGMAWLKQTRPRLGFPKASPAGSSAQTRGRAARPRAITGHAWLPSLQPSGPNAPLSLLRPATGPARPIGPRARMRPVTGRRSGHTTRAILNSGWKSRSRLRCGLQSNSPCRSADSRRLMNAGGAGRRQAIRR